MNKCLIIISVLVGLVACKKTNTSTIFLSNVYGNEIHWTTLPIRLTFSNSFPEDKKQMLIKEISDLHKITHQTIFVLDTQTVDDNFPSKNNKNIIYWGSTTALKFSPSEQAKVSSHWSGTEIVEVDMLFNSDKINGEIDFPTLIRHELTHALGIIHQNEGLMNPYLPNYTQRGWDMPLLLAWNNQMTKLGVMTKNSGTESLASLEK